ncbi:CHAD domain-containing protein [Streptomyces spectabilis]|uniref:CHAD domain-containing protein n=2 Tax=Streptomyces spectabilis TaxID=68270 RepID=A0A516RL73_STRST|nr:CHAD domain-containing protein [Streptomyces spectabilis]QDQ16411.1 CHAD domain-containing protein [Streptomyces spectabilis]
MTAGEALSVYLQDQATEFLRSLRLHRESSTDAQGAEEALAAARALRRAARRVGATLHTFRPLLDQEWTEGLRPELAWLSGTLAREHAYAARLDRLLGALHRLSTPAPAVVPPAGSRPAGRDGPAQPPAPRTGEARAGQSVRKPAGQLAVGAAKAAALLERQLTLARTRAHSAALQAFGSSRFHAVADSVAVMASDVPLRPAPDTDLKPLAAAADAHLTEAVAALPLLRAGHPYNAEALVHGLAADTAPEAQDAPWLKVRSLLRLHRYAQEVLLGAAPPDARLAAAGAALDRHREAAEAAAAAAAAARTPRIAPATAYALGVLHADQRHEVEAARFAFQQAWLREAVTAP